jgi:hypothetical protein
MGAEGLWTNVQTVTTVEGGMYNRLKEADPRGPGMTRVRRDLIRRLGVTAFVTCALLAFAALAPRPMALPDESAATGVLASADLDGDGALETVWLGRGRQGVVSTDGPVTYTSRDKWRVVVAALGDTDGNGLPEVVTLLDGPDGRHLGLLAWFAGHYAERMVSAPLAPPPLDMRLLAGGSGGGMLVELTERVEAAGQGGTEARVVNTVYRWNGFGYVAVVEGEEGAP